MTTTTPSSTLVQAYLDLWNATEPATRRSLIEQVCTPDVRYVDPLADVTGTVALDGLVAGVQQQFPGMRFVALGDVDAHHDVCRFRWGLASPTAAASRARAADGAEPAVIGFDVAVVAADGRIATVHGFLDRVPGGA